MVEWDLPAGLRDVEGRLCGLRPAPPAALRERVMGRVREELARDRTRSRWTFAAGLAAAVLLWANLSMSATQATDYRPRDGVRADATRRLAAEIHRVVPEMSLEEALREAALLQVGLDRLRWPWGTLPPMPASDMRDPDHPSS